MLEVTSKALQCLHQFYALLGFFNFTQSSQACSPLVLYLLTAPGLWIASLAPPVLTARCAGQKVGRWLSNSSKRPAFCSAVLPDISGGRTVHKSMSGRQSSSLWDGKNSSSLPQIMSAVAC